MKTPFGINHFQVGRRYQTSGYTFTYSYDNPLSVDNGGAFEGICYRVI